MRDLETIEIAITAAETGHLVMSTLHTLDAPETITRIVSAFPPYQQKQVRLQLGSILKAVISQRLVPRADGRGRVAAVEVMRSTARTRELIEDKDRTKELHDAISQGGTSYGMQTFDQSLMRLLTTNLITYEEALRQTTNPDDFALRVSGIGGTSDSSWDGFDNNMARPTPGHAPAAPAPAPSYAPPPAPRPAPPQYASAPPAYAPPAAPSYAPPGAPPGFSSASPPSFAQPPPRPAPAASGVATMPPGFPRTVSGPQPAVARPAPAPTPAANPDDDFTIERF
jgi:twitching motility protein PilT